MIRFNPVVMQYDQNISGYIYVADKFVTARMKKSQKLIMENDGRERQCRCYFWNLLQ